MVPSTAGLLARASSSGIPSRPVPMVNDALVRAHSRGKTAPDFHRLPFSATLAAPQSGMIFLLTIPSFTRFVNHSHRQSVIYSVDCTTKHYQEKQRRQTTGICKYSRSCLLLWKFRNQIAVCGRLCRSSLYNFNYLSDRFHLPDAMLY